VFVFPAAPLLWAMGAVQCGGSAAWLHDVHDTVFREMHPPGWCWSSCVNATHVLPFHRLIRRGCGCHGAVLVWECYRECVLPFGVAV
jgi:hypothetical protein